MRCPECAVPIDARTLQHLPGCRHAARERDRERRLVTQYGITAEEYDRILEEQNGTCGLAGCDRTTADRTGRRLNVDHDHVTGETRGLLCAYHNRMMTRAIEKWVGVIAAYVADPPARRALGRVVQGRTGRVKKKQRGKASPLRRARPHRPGTKR